MDQRDRRERGLAERSMWETHMTRRKLLRTTGLGAVGLFASGALLAACGGEEEPTATGATGAALDHVNVGFGYIGPVTDNGWTTTHDRGRKAMEAALGDKITTTFVENVPISAEAGPRPRTLPEKASFNRSWPAA